VKSESGACEPPPIFSGSVEHAVAHIEESIENLVEPRFLRWYAVKLFERDEQVIRELKLGDDLMAHINEHIADCEKELDDDAESIVIGQRYDYITAVVKKAVRKKRSGPKLSASDRIDRIVTDRVLALPIFALIMFLVYYISITAVGGLVTDWMNDTLFGDLICGNLSAWFVQMNVEPWLTGLVINGMVSGVGAVLSFVPQMLILFFMLSVLEDVGYMARVAFIMDKLFRRFGLSGKSFIPMLIGSGCSVPGIMASRTIESEKDRRMTIMTTAFIPCGAKMPMIALFAGAFFGGSGLIATSAYFVGVAAVVVSGIILKKTKPFRGEAAPFIMELPEYHVPAMANVLRFTWERGWSFIRKAGTIILAASVILWFLQAFGVQDGAFRLVTDSDKSLLAVIGGFIAPVFAPLGFGNWKAAVATLAGLTAKENVVSTLAVLYGFAGAGAGATWGALTADFTPLTAYSFMLFNLLCAPCFAAMGAIRREMNSAKWTFAAIGYMSAFAYVVSFLVYQLGTLAAETSATVRVAAVVFAIFAAVVWKLAGDRKKRKNGICTGACAGCPRAESCGKRR
jgi:ferrous iron transport protein B